MLIARANLTATLLPDGQVLRWVFGTSPHNETELWSEATLSTSMIITGRSSGDSAGTAEWS
jgi:hypothetical protein